MTKIFTKEGFDIYFEAIPETEPIEDTLSFAKTGLDHSDTIKKVNSGEYEHFVAHVVAKMHNIQFGEEFLGGCIYKNPEEFTKEECSYFDDMVRTLIVNAKDVVRDLCEQDIV